jgi:ArsR family transcriptional regulator
MEVLAMPQSTVSRHLAYLKNAGLISGRRRGVWMYYRLAAGKDCLHKGLLELLTSCLPQATEAENDLKRLASFLRQKDDSTCYQTK